MPNLCHHSASLLGFLVIVKCFAQKSLDQDLDTSAQTAENPQIFTLSDEKRLIKRLLKNYEDAGITGRPVQHTEERVLVNMSLSLIQILDLDEKNQVLTISVWLLFNWKDHILRWNPEDYSQVVEVRVPPKQIWTPDIVLYNYADERLKEMRDAMVVVHYDGSIKWMPPAIFKSNCKIDIKSFPFDEQTCHMKFGSWTYDGNRLDVSFIDNEQHVLLDDYTESNEWEIIARPAMRNVKYYPCCQEPYPDLTYFLFLRRNAAFFSYILVLPCVLLSSLTLIIFWLPPESPAKMVLGMNIFVAFFLLLLLLADSTPQASTSVPYIGYYYCLNMVLITLSSFLSVIVINMYFRGDRRNRVPWWIQSLCRTMTNPSGKGEYDKTVNEDTKQSANTIHTDESKLAMETRDRCKQSPTKPKKSIIFVEDRQKTNATNGKKGSTKIPTKGKRDRTRFANVEATDETLDGLLPSHYEQTLSSADVRHYGIRIGLNQHRKDRQFHSSFSGKVRSQSLPPVGDSVENMTAESERFVPEVICPCSRRSHAQNRDMHYWYCVSIPQPICCHVHSRCCPTGAESTIRTRHQKHPESCHMCLQHLSALRMQRREQHAQCTVYRADATQFACKCAQSCMSNEAIADQHKVSTGVCNLTNRPCKQHSTNGFPICCHKQNGTVRYEYTDGQLRLVPVSLPNTTTVKYTSPQMIAPQRLTNRVDGQMTAGRTTKNLERELQDISAAIRSFLARIVRKDAEDIVVREWRMAAMVLDRTFFVCYLIIHLCAAFGLLIPSSQKANAIEFMREYRLKNYNATYTDQEAASLSPLALSPVNPGDRVFGHSLDRLTLKEDDTLGSMGIKMSTAKGESEKKQKMGHADGLFSSKNSLETGSGKLSPYQQLADKWHSKRPQKNGPSTNYLPQDDYSIFHSTSGPIDAG